jgi:hypothetical protein
MLQDWLPKWLVIQPTRYKVITVFVDQATHFGFIHFQKSTSAQETLEATELFEQHAASLGPDPTLPHPHGVFASKLWRAHCIATKQGLTFAGVGGHHQTVLLKPNQTSSNHKPEQCSFMQPTWPTAATANLLTICHQHGK